MKEQRIKIEPFHFSELLTMSGHQEINEHGYLTFSGYMNSELLDSCMAFVLQDNPLVQIYVIDEEENEHILFAGVLTELNVTVENQLRLVEAKVLTGSYLMDLSPHIRSFQSPSITYEQVLSTIATSYPDSFTPMNVGKGEAINNFFLQYQESDWTFAKRLASQLHTVLLANAQYGYPSFQVGIPMQEDTEIIETNTYQIVRNIGIMLEHQGHGLFSQTQENTSHYQYKTREIYWLGQKVILNQMPLYVASIDTCLEGGELYHTYTFALEGWFQVPEYNNENVIGVSLVANVTGVSKDKVTVTIQKDENAANAGSTAFPYATVYSSQDGTGWYFMPEIGDIVRLHIPCEKEFTAYVASSVHSALTSGERSNPNIKFIKNRQGKEVRFTPSSIVITNNAGMSIELSDQFGIQINSSKNITIQSGSNVSIASTGSSVQMVAPQDVSFIQGGSKMQLQDRMFLKGTQLRLD